MQLEHGAVLFAKAKGASNCPVGKTITTVAECRKAAAIHGKFREEREFDPVIARVQTV